MRRGEQITAAHRAAMQAGRVDGSDWDGYARDVWVRADTLDPGVRAITKLNLDALDEWLEGSA